MYNHYSVVPVSHEILLNEVIPDLVKFGVQDVPVFYKEDGLFFACFNIEEKCWVSFCYLEKLLSNRYLLETYGVRGFAGIIAKYTVNYFKIYHSKHTLRSACIEKNIESAKLLNKLGFSRFGETNLYQLT